MGAFFFSSLPLFLSAEGHSEASLRGGPGPSSALLPRCGRSAPRPGGFCKDIVPAPTMRGAAPLCTPPDAGAPPCTRVTFSPMRKSPKNLQGLRPLESPSAESPPLLRSLTHRAGLPSATKIDRFATLRLWANRSVFLSGFCRRGIFAFQSVARGCSSCGCRRCTVRGLPCFWA